MKSRKRGGAEHVARMGWRKVAWGYRWGDMREEDYFDGLDVDGRIIL
jgi:hypothetical protein